MQGFQTLSTHKSIFKNIRRGIERESLRVTRDGKLALTPHPVATGAALTNARITTDYSEALLELITGVHTSVPAMLQELTQLHQFTLRNMNSDEVMWMHSMPCELPDEQDIPIADFGTSNSGMLKHVYRRGLAVRYGKRMQCIAGIHYNFSLPDELWELLGYPGQTPQERQSAGYIALVRNFKRYSWLLMYLFGASPVANTSFVEGLDHNLKPLDNKGYHLPEGTSLRMSDIGYKSEAQSGLRGCYNSLQNYVEMIYDAVTKPWPDYAKLGTHMNGQWVQLNTNVLQIENEFYASIRPKRTTGRGERPVSALIDRGVQYIEVRCLDVDPESPIGISESTCYFMDTFLVYCALLDSPLFQTEGSCPENEAVFGTVVNKGRTPDLQVRWNGESRKLREWGLELIADMQATARQLDEILGTTGHSDSLALQKRRIENPDLTLSARDIAKVTSNGASFNEATLQTSLKFSDDLRSSALDSEIEEILMRVAKDSLQEQKELEESDDMSFDEYIKAFHENLKKPAGRDAA